MGDGIVIVGAGHGGSQAAVSLRQEGYEGPLVLLSDEPEIPYHRPPLSKTFLKSPDAVPQMLRAESVYADNRIALRLGTSVRSIDPRSRRLVLSDGGTLAYGRLLLATGAAARRLPFAGREPEGTYTLRTAADARALRDGLQGGPHAVVIVGGGFIGLEAAALLATLGHAVTVVEAAGRLMQRSVAPEVAAHMADNHRALGVRLLFCTSVERVEEEAGRVRAVVTAAGERLAADILIVGIGAKPNVVLAEAAGIACDNGIRVGPGLETSLPHIHAIGDCVSFRHWQAGTWLRLESVQNATDQARHVARAMLGRPGEYRDVPWFWSDQGSVKLQMVGLSAGADRHFVSGAPADNAFSVFHFRGGRLLAIDSVNRPADHMLGRRMLAAGFSPDEALIAAGAGAMKAALAAHEAATADVS